MHLKSLEIAGFKSFPDKIKLDFSLGITAVVGPNGSGKSNIADAVRWVMGEQSVKSLRGGKMEDIIFSGTEHRRPLGYADVTMVLDNSDKTLAADFTEVSVSRKVFRSGESEFAINGSPCRLKDVHLLFMDTGVGREGYSIIGQGKIEEVLSARSEDRRQLFEEAAGITKFKTRRTETLVKLEREKQNIVRVSDLINEYENQLEPLREQAEEARRFLLLKEQYKSAYINVFLLDADRYEEAIGKIDNDLKNIAAQSENSQMQLQDLRLICETLRESAGHTDDEYRSANRRVVDLTAEMEKKDGEINILREQFSTCEKNIERILREHDKNEKKLIDKGAEKEKFSASFDAAEKELVLAENELNVKQSEFAELENAVREREKHIDAYNEIIIGKMHSLSEAKNVQKDFEQEYFRHEEKKERINSEILHSEAAAEKQETAIVNLNNEIVSIEDEIESSEKKHAAYILALSQLNSESASTENERRETEKTLNECMSRHKILSEMEHDLEGYSRSVKAVLRKKQNDPLFEKNICGAVCDLLTIPSEYETAVDVALGQAAQNIVTETENGAAAAIEFLKKTNEGRATFLPLTVIKPRTLGQDALKLIAEPGAVAAANELIGCEPRCKNIFGYLLGNVLVVKNMSYAMQIFSKYKHMHRIVTLDGELFTPGGAVTGGSINKSQASPLGRRQKIVSLSDRISVLNEKFTGLKKTSADLKEKRDYTAAECEKTKADIHRLKIGLNSLASKKEQAEEEYKKIILSGEKCRAENETVMAQLVETNRIIRNAVKNTAEAEESVLKSKNELENYVNLISEERNEKDFQTAEITNIKVRIGQLKQKMESEAENHSRLEKECAAIILERDVLFHERAEQKKRAEEKNEGIAEAIEQKERLTVMQNVLAEELAEIETRRSSISNAIEKADRDEREQQGAAAVIQQEIIRLTMRREQFETESREIYSNVWDEYGLTYQSALSYKKYDMSDAALKRDMKRLRDELAELQNVNVGAIESYKTIKDRFNFLSGQRDDIIRAETKLTEIIESLTAQMEETFAERFSIISNHFSEVFKEMFGGGSAGLSLSDEKNMLESGVEITAQPPGKRLQTISLLSGGERALTAIALLFGILRMKPSPFCVLDEIESALDDANVVRFAHFLKNHAQGTQFIVITHRKGTMEAADAMYGVTMQELGISKMVSVKFGDG